MKNLYQKAVLLFSSIVSLSIGMSLVFGIFYLICLSAVAIASLPIGWSIGLGIGLVLLGAVNTYMKISARGDNLSQFSGSRGFGSSVANEQGFSSHDALWSRGDCVYANLSHSSEPIVDAEQWEYGFHPSKS